MPSIKCLHPILSIDCANREYDAFRHVMNSQTAVPLLPCAYKISISWNVSSVSLSSIDWSNKSIDLWSESTLPSSSQVKRDYRAQQDHCSSGISCHGSECTALASCLFLPPWSPACMPISETSLGLRLKLHSTSANAPPQTAHHPMSNALTFLCAKVSFRVCSGTSIGHCPPISTSSSPRLQTLLLALEVKLPVLIAPPPSITISFSLLVRPYNSSTVTFATVPYRPYYRLGAHQHGYTCVWKVVFGSITLSISECLQPLGILSNGRLVTLVNAPRQSDTISTRPCRFRSNLLAACSIIILLCMHKRL